jgi:hypothetical protein
VLRDEALQPEAFIQLAHENEAGVGGDDPWNATFRKPLNVS